MPLHSLFIAVSTGLNFVWQFFQKACLPDELYVTWIWSHGNRTHACHSQGQIKDVSAISLEIKTKKHFPPMSCSVLYDSDFRKTFLLLSPLKHSLLTSFLKGIKQLPCVICWKFLIIFFGKIKENIYNKALQVFWPALIIKRSISAL